jgi:hypothetical protein
MRPTVEAKYNHKRTIEIIQNLSKNRCLNKEKNQNNKH